MLSSQHETQSGLSWSAGVNRPQRSWRWEGGVAAGRLTDEPSSYARAAPSLWRGERTRAALHSEIRSAGGWGWITRKTLVPWCFGGLPATWRNLKTTRLPGKTRRRFLIDCCWGKAHPLWRRVPSKVCVCARALMRVCLCYSYSVYLLDWLTLSFSLASAPSELDRRMVTSLTSELRSLPDRYPRSRNKLPPVGLDGGNGYLTL